MASTQDALAREAEQRWGDTEAWRESRRRTASYDAADWQQLKAEQEAVVAELAAAMRAGEPPTSARAVAAAEAHRQLISRWFYDCSPQLHFAVSRLYVDDVRFATFFDEVAPGLARYVAAAVEANAAR